MDNQQVDPLQLPDVQATLPKVHLQADQGLQEQGPIKHAKGRVVPGPVKK